MTRLESLYQQKFVLECKDHWTQEDWKLNDRLNAEIRELEPVQPKPITDNVPEWPKEFVELVNGIPYYHWKQVDSYEEAVAYARITNTKQWELRPLVK